MAARNSKTAKVNRKLLLKNQKRSKLSLFDADSPDIEFFDNIDAELIGLAGSPVLIYKHYKSKVDYDDVYQEARGKTIATQPIKVMCHYEPKIVEEPLTEFGIELTNDQLFTFNKSTVVAALGREIQNHDIIQPEFQNLKFEVFEVQEESFEAYGVYHLVCSARLLRDTNVENFAEVESNNKVIGQVGDVNTTI